MVVCLSSFPIIKTAVKNSYSVYVVIDPGHGGSDGGAVSKNGLKESSVTLTVSKRLKKMFLKYGIGVVLTREKDVSLGNTKRQDMEKRKEIIENVRPAAVISVHANTFSYSYRRGAQVFYWGENGKILAECVQSNINIRINSVYSGKNYSALTGDYYILKCTDAPSCIVECGFLSNPKDEQLLQDTTYIDELCFAVFSGTIAYLQKNEINV